ncbi:hypothetical protein HaLaN_01386, partial [Haematococcus lacustris]
MMAFHTDAHITLLSDCDRKGATTRAWCGWRAPVGAAVPAAETVMGGGLGDGGGRAHGLLAWVWSKD